MSQKSWHKLSRFSQAIIKVSSSRSLIQRPDWRRNYLEAYSNCSQNCLLCGWRIYVSFLLIFGQGLGSALRGQLQFFVKWSSSNMASCIFKVNMRELDMLARLLLDAYHLTYTSVHWLEASSRSHYHSRWGGFHKSTDIRRQGSWRATENLSHIMQNRNKLTLKKAHKIVLNT